MSDKPTQSIEELRAQVSHMLERLDPEKPISSTAVFKVNEAKEGTFERNISMLASATKKMPGVKVFDYHKKKTTQPRAVHREAVEYLIYEDWLSTKAFRNQWNSAHLKQFQSTVGDLVVAPPDLSIYQDSDGGRRDTRVLQTGQNGCWNTSGIEIPAKGTGQDGEYRAGMEPPVPRFQDNRDGTVTDELTGLIWLKNADAFGEVSWEQALHNAKYLASGNHDLRDGGSAGDWRLPNLRELLSIIDYGTGDPIITKDHPFIHVKRAIYWTSTTLAAAPKLAWMMTLGIGPTVFDLKVSPSNRMWPVRGESTRIPRTGQKQCWDSQGNPLTACQRTGHDGDIQAGVPFPDPRFNDNGDGTVTDNMTGLVWLKNGDPFGLKTWQESLTLCNELASGGYGLSDGSMAGDWRLPNIREIESLVDYNNFGPCLPTGHPFVDVRPSSYWTSTTVTAAPTEAMFIILGVGPSIFESKEHTFFVWPVRDMKSSR